MEDTIRKWDNTFWIGPEVEEYGALRGSAVFVEPGAGIGTSGMTCEIFLPGIIVGCLDQSSRYAPVTDGARHVGMDDVHYPSSQDICKIGGMTF